MISRTRKGKKGEDVAVEYLTRKGYRIVSRNFRWRGGEIDIIARKKGILVFVEVRSFSTSAMEINPVETIGPYKIQKLIKTAEFFVETHPEFQNHDLRFDAIGVKFNGKDVKIDHVENAFLKE